ncbi:hypothetical protein ACFE04_031843 [Oxalis oulophora]
MKKSTRRSAIGLPLEEGLTLTIGNFTTKFSLASFIKRVDKLNNEQRNLIKKMGFGNLLLLPNHKLNKNLLAEMMELWNIEKGVFFITPDDSRELRISLLDVGLILGLPVKGNPIVLVEDLPYCEVESEYGSVPGKRQITVSALEKRLNSIGEAANEDFVRTFLLFTFGTILFPNKKGDVDTRYLYYLEDLSSVGGFSWGEAVLQDMIIWLNMRKETKMEFMGGCLILLLIWCYEHVNIDRPNLVDSGFIFPRACRWESSSTRNFHRRKWFTDKFKELQDDQITWELEPTHVELQVNVIKDLLAHCGEADELLTRQSSSSACSLNSVEVLSNSGTNTLADQADSDCASTSQNVSMSQHAPDCVSSPGNFTTSSNSKLSGKSVQEDYLILENEKLVEDIAHVTLGIEKLEMATETETETEKTNIEMEKTKKELELELEKMKTENSELKKEMKTSRREMSMEMEKMTMKMENSELKKLETETENSELKKENEILRIKIESLEFTSLELIDRIDRILSGEDLSD